MDKFTRIAKNMVARSQITKSCSINGGTCRLVIDESIYLQESMYCFENLCNDIRGFVYDTNRELACICNAKCSSNEVILTVDKANSLLNLGYECNIAGDDANKEAIMTNEWVVEE